MRVGWEMISLPFDVIVWFSFVSSWTGYCDGCESWHYLDKRVGTHFITI